MSVRDQAGLRPAVGRAHPPHLAMKLVNPLMRVILRSPLHRLVSGHLVLLEFTGRRSGRRLCLPVAWHQVDRSLCVFTNSNWRANFRDRRPLEVTIAGRRHAAHGWLDEDADLVAEIYSRQIEVIGLNRARRALAIRVNVERAPTIDELRDAVRATGLSVLWVELDLCVERPGLAATGHVDRVATQWR